MDVMWESPGVAGVLPISGREASRRQSRCRLKEKDYLATEVGDRWVEFQNGLSDKRRYPLQRFKAFVEIARRYAELTRADPLIHRRVVRAINGLTDFLAVERKRVPKQVLWDAQRLECLLFSGYDPRFEGDEPPG